MTINWRQRAPILRVLAAVYAELGEEVFKGRYGRIAKLYGNEATYDAIKSFFAKEVVKMADVLKARTPDQVGGSDEILNGQCSRVTQRPIRLTFDDSDDEIIVMGERGIDMVVGNGQTTGIARQGRVRHGTFDNERDVRSPMRNSTVHKMSRPRLDFSATPGPSSSTQVRQQISDACTGKQVRRGKRPYSHFEESNDLQLSFRYVTNRGKHCCALCQTELPSADILRKHESLSELHLANLRNPETVARGYATLADYNGISEDINHQQNHQSRVQSQGRGFRERNLDMARQQSEQRERYTSHHRLGSATAENEDLAMLDTIQVAEPRRGQVRCSPLRVEENVNGNEGENGSPPEVELLENSMNGTRGNADKAVPRNQSQDPETRSHPQIDNGASEQQQSRSAGAHKRSRNDTHLEDVPPTWIAQILLSSGMELLAKKCIEEHPELKAGFYKHIRDMQAARSVRTTETGHGIQENGDRNVT